MTDSQIRKIKYRWHLPQERSHCGACLRFHERQRHGKWREKKFILKYGWSPVTLEKFW